MSQTLKDSKSTPSIFAREYGLQQFFKNYLTYI